jgi:predicted NAD-dependent protein-ADP-ribosyltransferase YbiA (DUF1768 family)
MAGGVQVWLWCQGTFPVNGDLKVEHYMMRKQLQGQKVPRIKKRKKKKKSPYETLGVGAGRGSKSNLGWRPVPSRVKKGEELER